MNLFFDNYTRKCKTTIGGVKKMYLLPYVKYSRSQIKDSGMSLTEFPDSYIYEFNCIGTYNQNSEDEGGSFFFSQSVNIRLSEVYNVLNIHDFLKIDFRVIVKTNNDDLIMFGVYNGLEGSTTNASGSDKGEFNGCS